jgi:hypothetical protein
MSAQVPSSHPGTPAEQAPEPLRLFANDRAQETQEMAKETERLEAVIQTSSHMIIRLVIISIAVVLVLYGVHLWLAGGLSRTTWGLVECVGILVLSGLFAPAVIIFTLLGRSGRGWAFGGAVFFSSLLLFIFSPGLILAATLDPFLIVLLPYGGYFGIAIPAAVIWAYVYIHALKVSKANRRIAEYRQQLRAWTENHPGECTLLCS